MDVRVIRDGDIPEFGVVSVEHEEMEATCLVCDWLEAVFPDDGCWIKASSVTSQFL